MSEVTNSATLMRLMMYAKTLGSSQNTPFTAERFLVAIIDLADIIPKGEKTQDFQRTEQLVRWWLKDLKAAKAVLLNYISSENPKAYLDDLYMKRKCHKAGAELTKRRMSELSAEWLLKSIMKDPTDTIKMLVKTDRPEEPEDSLQSQVEKIDPLTEELWEDFDDWFDDGLDDEEDFQSYDDEELARETKKAVRRTEIAKLVTEVKKIRKTLSSTVFGQENAVHVFTTGYFQAKMRAIVESDSARPSATFLLAGPPGVGKTFLAETAAQAMGLPYMRFDMSEYADKEANLEFCGSDRVYKNSKAGNVTGFVEENPRCVLLFDEVEKAHMCVIHLFLQMLDAGRLRDNYTDHEVPFKNAIIFFTTNAGKQLYENSESGDFSNVSRKVILKTLQDDINPVTGNPYFPAAICSRFASGNVVMFNHISANFLKAIAQKEIERHTQTLKEKTGIEMQVEDKIYSALLFAEGASVDARTVRSRAESFFNDELFELFRLVDSGKIKTGIDCIEKIQVSVDLHNAKPEVCALFEAKEPPRVMVFSNEATVRLCQGKLPAFHIVGVQDCQPTIEQLKSGEFDFVLLDMGCGVHGLTQKHLNIEDADTPARDFYKYLCESRKGMPVYLIEGSERSLSEEEKLSFIKQGVRGFLPLSGEKKAFAAGIADIAAGLYQQAAMEKLARANKLITFQSAQFVSRNGKRAEIKLFDLTMSVAVDAEDRKNVLSAVSRPNVSFDDVIGAGDAKRELAYFVEYLKNPKKYAGTGVKAPKGVLLYGPPGTGKTMLAKAMAKEANVTFIAAEGNQFLKSLVGAGSEKVHELFRTARKYAPAILFIDEIDAIAKERRGNDGNGEETLTAFLTEMDGFSNDTSRPVFVLAATNFDVEPGRSKSLDPALMRRFDRRVYIELPDRQDRIRFMNLKIEKNPAFAVSQEQVENLALRSTGMSLAELDSAMELALRSAIREGSTKVTDAILEEAFETFNNGEIKKWDASQLERVARHEAGHAFMSWYQGETPSYLTVVARGSHGGYMQHADREGKNIYTKEELLERIRTALGGRAAEIAYYGDEAGISTGAGGDLLSATNTARNILCTYGMDSLFGLAVVASDFQSDGAMSVEVRENVNRILQAQMAEAVRVIGENKDKIDALAAALMVKNHMSGPEIDRILSGGGEISPISDSR